VLAVSVEAVSLVAAALSVLLVPLCICRSRACSSEASCWKADEKSLLEPLVVLLVEVLLVLLALLVLVRNEVELADDALEVEDAELYQST